MIGDDVNGTLARAEVGIAMGGGGTKAALTESAGRGSGRRAAATLGAIWSGAGGAIMMRGTLRDARAASATAGVESLPGLSV